jgi:predicted nucleotidyltransferase component of viral defense system
MITKEQVHALAKKKKVNEMTVFREYLQLLFLSELYKEKESQRIFFKGGTAIHLILKAPRFSEDLDFTVELDEGEFLQFINASFERISKIENVKFREKDSLAGKRFLLVAPPEVMSHETFVNLDFSFREKALKPEKAIIRTDYPVTFTSFVYHLSKDELFAEKIRAVLTRGKGRDLYDLWFLLDKGATLKRDLVKEKLKYYKLERIQKEEILEKIEGFSRNDFILDLRPFVPLGEREKLGDLFGYIVGHLRENL